jgi:hypothetical protein
VQIDYDVMHLRTSLVQLFVLLHLNFEEVVQIIELMRFGGAPSDYPFTALVPPAARKQGSAALEASGAEQQSALLLLICQQVREGLYNSTKCINITDHKSRLDHGTIYSEHHNKLNVTPDFTRKTECISRVRQDQFTHT